MSSRSNHLLLSVAIGGFGAHPGAAHNQPQRFVDVAYYRRLVQTAERGLLDFVLLHDERAIPSDYAAGRLDARAVLARLAPETHAVGLAVSVPTTYLEPFTVSRELATLDFVSGGRAAWNVTTFASDAEALNYDREAASPAEQRQAIASEFVAVSRKLWDSWEDDAVVTDRDRGWYLNPHKLHHINHVGEYFRIRGPQITYRPPQGHVVVIASDAGDPGVPLSATSADVLILHHATLAEAQQAYAHAHQEAAAAGREIRVLQAILPIVAATEEQAQTQAAALDAAADPSALAPRALGIVGTAAQIADQLQAWFEASAADGFHVLPASLPEDLDQLTSELVPELQRRGLFRTSYSGRTLREHLGLTRPESQYIGAPSEAHTAYDRLS